MARSQDQNSNILNAAPMRDRIRVPARDIIAATLITAAAIVFLAAALAGSGQMTRPFAAADGDVTPRHEE